MNTLVISDTHLNHKFEEKKFNYLLNLFNKHDQIILNGDFWEGLLMSFDEFIDSPWKGLFPILKRKDTIYLYGNHDKQKRSDDRVSLFSNRQGNEFEIKTENKIFHIEHGHRLIRMFKVPSLILDLDAAIRTFEVTENYLIKRNIDSYIKFTNRFNKRIKKKIKKNGLSEKIVICGHTHSPEDDLEHGFLNEGFVKHGFASHITIENGTPVLTKDFYD